MAVPLRRLIAVLALAFGLLTAGAAPAFALDDPEDGPEPPPYEMTVDFVDLAPGEIACTGRVFIPSVARFSYQLVTSGEAQQRAKFTLRQLTSPESVVFFARLDPIGPPLRGVIDVRVQPGLYRACVRNPTASNTNMSVNFELRFV